MTLERLIQMKIIYWTRYIFSSYCAMRLIAKNEIADFLYIRLIQCRTNEEYFIHGGGGVNKRLIITSDGFY